MAEPLVGQIILFAGGFVPIGWLPCDGQLLEIYKYRALFSVLGTQFGGDGHRTFGLPDLCGRVPVGAGTRYHEGQEDTYISGQLGGQENIALDESQLPAHSHSIHASKERTVFVNPTGAFPAAGGTYNDSSDIEMHPNMVGITGKGKPINVMQPYLTIQYCIAYEGTFPIRDNI